MPFAPEAGVFDSTTAALRDDRDLAAARREQRDGPAVRAAFDGFIDVSDKGDHDVAALMREAEIDMASI